MLLLNKQLSLFTADFHVGHHLQELVSFVRWSGGWELGGSPMSRFVLVMVIIKAPFQDCHDVH